MIEFVLDVIGDLSLAIAHYETSDTRSRDIRAFIAFYDSIKEIEINAENLIKAFAEYTNSYPNASDPSRLRVLIRRFSSSIYKLAETFRAVGLRNSDPLEYFSRELAESFITIGSALRPMFCRSLLEIASPDICINQALPAIERNYWIRVVDYQKSNCSAEDVQKRWNLLFANVGMPNLLWKTAGFPFVITESAITAESGERWVSESGTYDFYAHQVPAVRPETMQLNESFIRLVYGFKVISFADIAELKDQIQRDAISLQRLRGNRVDLETFLIGHFSMADFFGGADRAPNNTIATSAEL
jgi:hypothetical protein